MKKRFGLLGTKLGHSFSPLIHEYLGDYEYRLFEVCPQDLDSFMTKRHFDGINVTIPYKQSVVPYCASLSDEARSSGCVNTIIKDENELLHGYNTDQHGFRVLLEHSNVDPHKKKALVLGNGGAAKSSKLALIDLGVREVVTVSRHGNVNYDNIWHHHDADIIVNATPVGMYPNNESAPISLNGFTQLSGVVDMIYNPLRTKLLLESERLGVQCVNGLIMLVAQAEMASRLFLGKPARPNLVDDIASRVLKKSRNIALIGMPSSGKSTIARLLAQKMKRPFVDIDNLIEIEAEKSIPKIFAEEGEEEFRKLETRVLGEESKKNGIVIATGGGVVTKPDNLYLLRQNSLIIYLKRELNELALQGRPLSLHMGVQTIAKQRLPLYEAWSDCIVSVEADPVLTTVKILEAIS